MCILKDSLVEGSLGLPYNCYLMQRCWFWLDDRKYFSYNNFNNPFFND